MNTNTELTPIIQEQEITPQIPGVEIIPLAGLFVRFIQAAGKRSENTARAYGQSVAMFLQWLGKRQGVELARPVDIECKAKNNRTYYKKQWELYGDTTPLLDVDLATLDTYSLWLGSKGNSQKTVNQRIGAVNSFLSVAFRDKIIDKDQADHLGIKPYKAKQRRNVQPVGRRLEAAEVRKLRSIVDLKAKTQRKALRDRAIFDLMLYAGLRRDEVATLEVSNIKQDGARWWLVFSGKGDKPRRVKIHDTLYQSIANLVEAQGRELGNGDNGHIFYNLNKGGKPTENRLNASVVGRLVAEYGAAAGLAPIDGKNRLSPHDLRRTCAKNAYTNGATIYQVQTMLGHSDPKTTIRYIGALEDDTDTAVDYVKY